MELKFQIEKHSNTGRTFHTNVVVGKTSIEHYAPWLSRSFEDALHNQTWHVAKMVRDLLRIDGVHDIFVKPYEVSVHMDWMNRPFQRWSEKIDRIVKEAFEAAYAEVYPVSRKRLTITTFPNNRRRGFATTFEISNSRFETFDRPLRISSMEYLRNVGIDGGGELVRILMQISGITEVSIQPFEATVEIGNAFDWAETDHNGKCLVDNIIAAFKRVFGNDIVVTSK